ncbi:hypothetical protein ACFYY8_06230 [Streptosporangium sp. NPDC001559]|uniref:hypothetical protein n=1 Tax=Streptosporangium sp. NPDC001559 TaxID=3366187 RepID=UPI0036EA79E0
MAKRIVRRGSQQLRAELELLEELEPISDEHQEAKAAYEAALASGDRETIQAAKERKQAASNHLNETRTWLRREKEITKLGATIVAIEQRLVGPILDQDGEEDAAQRAELETALGQARAQLERAQTEAAVVRRELAALTGTEA